MTTASPTALSAMHHSQVALGAVMVEREGWLRAARFTSADDETERVRGGVGLLDLSLQGKLYLLGGEIDSTLAALFPQLPKLSVGNLVRQRLGAERGAREVELARLADDELLVLTAPKQARAVSEALSQSPADCVHAVDITSALAGVGVVGPLADRLLAGIIEVDLSPGTFPNQSCAQLMAAEVHGTLLRHDLGGLPRYDLYFSRDFGEYMWDALVEAGAPHGVVPFGLEALSLLGRRKD